MVRFFTFNNRRLGVLSNQAQEGGHYSDTTASAGGSDDEGSTAATDGSTLRTSPAEQVSYILAYVYCLGTIIHRKYADVDQQSIRTYRCNTWDTFYVRVVVVVARVVRAVEAIAEAAPLTA